MHLHLWGVIVAPSGAGLGRRSRATLASGAGRHTLFRQTLERAARLIAPDRLVAALARDHSASYDTRLPGTTAVRRVLQPAWRGSAPAAFLPLLRVAHEDPHATVAVFPADHLVDGEARFMGCVARAVDAVAHRPDLVFVIGAQPSGGLADRSWIEPGEAVEGLEAWAVRAVRRFVSRRAGAGPAALDTDEALVNTHVVVGRVERLLALGRRSLPDVLESLEPLQAALGRPEEPLLCDAVYEQMPYADLAHALFVRPHAMAVVAAAGVRLRRQAPVLLADALAG
jgi:mannose-1-phosphate guanylyltransferase